MCELLVPVRDEISFTTALNSGADAVYFGLGTLNMRINSKGIEPEMLADFVSRAHKANIRVYVTLNTIVYDEEISLVDELLTQIKTSGADAVICWDFAVIEKAREKKDWRLCVGFWRGILGREGKRHKAHETPHLAHYRAHPPVAWCLL